MALWIVPREAITIGIGTIMRAGETLLLVRGAEKADILAETMFGAVTPEIPASMLQFHPNCRVVTDEEVYGILERTNKREFGRVRCEAI